MASFEKVIAHADGRIIAIHPEEQDVTAADYAGHGDDVRMVILPAGSVDSVNIVPRNFTTAIGGEDAEIRANKLPNDWKKRFGAEAVRREAARRLAAESADEVADLRDELAALTSSGGDASKLSATEKKRKETRDGNRARRERIRAKLNMKTIAQTDIPDDPSADEHWQ